MPSHVPAAILRALYDHAPLMMGVVELMDDGDVLHLTDNAATARFFGASPEALEGRLSGAELGTPAEVLTRWVGAYRQCGAEGGPVRFEYAHAGPGGEHWLSILVAPAGAGEDGRDRYLYICEDASARKRAEDGLHEASTRLSTLVENFQGGVLVEDAAGRIALTNQAFCDLFGIEAAPDTLAGVSCADAASGLAGLVPDLDAFVARIGAVLTANEPVTGEPVELVDGRTLERTFVPIASPDGAALGRMWQYQDVTARVRATRQLAESEARYRLLAENVQDLVALHDVDGTYTWVAGSCLPLLGYTPEQLVGTTPYSLFHPEDQARIRAESHEPSTGGSESRVSYRIRHRDGHYVWFETLTTPILGPDGAVTQLQTSSRDVTDRYEMEARLIHDAHHDALTGLANRALFRTRLEVRLAGAAAPGALLYLDLERFKVVNDTLGHTTGDALLCEVARRMLRCTGPGDVVARLGGDEFAVLVSVVDGTGHVEALTAALRAAIAAPVTIEGRTIHTSASIGVVPIEAQPATADPDDRLRAADLAMYEAKRAGQPVVYDAAMEAAATRRLRLEIDLRQAADRAEFFLVYQPIVRLTDGALVSFEALLRWAHPELGLVGPSEFVAIAEESGQAAALDAWVLREGCRQMRAWQDALGRPLPFTLSINTSGHEFHRPVSADLVLDALREYDLDPSRLQIEITERLFIDEPEAVARVLDRLRGHGVRFALDDFGTGYSSLRLLHALPVDVVKIDRSFVGRMDEDPRAGALVEAVVRIADVLGKSVVAEGIETAAQLGHLRGMGSASGQGYLFARPLAADVATDVACRSIGGWEGLWATGAAA